MNPSIQTIISQLDLQPHPEGGFYRETYRSLGKTNGKHHSTAIYFLLTKDNFSAFHKIQSDEVWHFYAGSSLKVVWIDAAGMAQEVAIGNDFAKGQVPQYVVPANTWFAAYLPSGSEWALVGCTVAPGFEFAEFELAKRAELIKEFPKAEKMIEKLTRE